MASSNLSAPLLMLARLAGAGAGFLAQLILARLLSTEDLGIFFAATSFAALAGIVVCQGYPGIAQRFIARYSERKREALLYGFVEQARRETAVITTALMIVVAAFGFAWPELRFDMRVVLVSTAVILGAASALTLFGALASVQRRFALAQLPETLIRPLLFLPVVSLAGVLVAMSVGTTTAIYAVLTAALAMAQYSLIRPDLPLSRRVYRPRLAGHWRREAWSFALAILFVTSFADLAILLASPFLGAAGLAPFGIALKISLLIGFAVQIAQQVALPDLAEAHEREDVHAVGRSLLQATIFPSLVTGAALFGSAFLGEWFLSLFGPQYTVAKWPLFVLIGAQFLRALAGPGQSLLMLKGAQGTNAVICLGCSIFLALANAVLVPLFGLEGAAFAVLLTVALWVVSSAYVLRKKYHARVDLPFLVASSDGIGKR